MKIAIVHDYLREYGGAERVVETLHEIWPEAPLYTAFVDWPSFAKAPAGKVELFKSMDIRTSWVQHYALIKKFISPLRFLAPKIWSSFDLSEYDVVLSSSGWFMCRGISMEKPSAVSCQLSAKKPVHICYIHHPPRNLYGYATGSDWQKYALVRAYAAIVNFYLRHYDFEAAQAVDYFIANSKETQGRVEKFYRRESTVIYPPIDIKAISHQPSVISKNRTYYLSVGRLAWAKRVDLAIMACNRLKLPLKIVGVGKEVQYLKSIAGPTVEFVGSVSDGQLDQLYRGAKALIFCALDEDFGMVPVEAMARGTPVIALAQGGVLETVIPDKTGVLFEKPEVDNLKLALEKFENSNGNWKSEISKNCRKQAEKFGKEIFKKEILNFIKTHVRKPQ